MDSNRVWFIVHWLKVEPKQSTLFFSIVISFSIIEEEVEHAIGTLDGKAWQTCEFKSFFKDFFLLEIKSNSFEIEAILFFKDWFSFTTKSGFEDRTSFFFKTSSQLFLLLRFYFHLG